MNPKQTLTVAANRKEAATLAEVKTVSIGEAEFLSLPRPRERCRFSGLSRTGLIELLDSGKVKGLKIIKPGATRGKRLIVKQSLFDYLQSLAG